MTSWHNHVNSTENQSPDDTQGPGEPPGADPGGRPGRRTPEPYPIAVIGIGCRLPGASGPDAFWREVLDGGDHITAIPLERFDARAFQHSDREDGRPLLTSPFGGFLNGIEEFDAEFFSISPYEATRMDPQQRLFLETAWEAVEDAGLAPRDLAGSRTGVYTAHLSHSYWDRLHQAGVWDVHAMTGAMVHGGMPSRLAHVLDLHGPTASIDATCASSLLAVHLACQALRLGEIDAAVVGGVNLITAPEDSVMLSQGSMLSPTGRCRFCDTEADGIVRGEAVAAVILKPLERAVADGDRVYSVILGSATTNDGASGGQFLTPNVQGQQEALRAAYLAAGVSPREVDYVEAHGVGTPAGDYAELTALAGVLGAGREPDRPLLVGSAKTNFGHGEPASGLVGLIKASLSLYHRQIPATLHVKQLNPRIDWDRAGLRPVLGNTPWPESERPGLAGVSSFGITGANVHVVMSAAEYAPEALVEGGPGQTPAAHVLPFSARGAAALSAVAEGYAEQLRSADTEEYAARICYSAGARRAHHRFRGAVVGANADELAERLLRFRERADAAAPPPGAPTIAYVFPGIGAQWTGMGRELLAQCPAFARALRRYDEAVRAEAGWSVIELLASDDPLPDVGLAQPAVWAVECALADVWTHWGVTPDLAIGHSMGEVAAATISGALDLAAAAAVICRRSALMRRAAGGAMIAVGLPAAHAERLAERSLGRVEVAVRNSPTSTVLAGDAWALEQIELELEDTDVFCRRLRVDAAAHSRAMDPLLADLSDQLAGLRSAEGRFPISSTVYDREVCGSECDAQYWADNMRLPVRFDEAVRRVLETRERVLFIEMTPHPLLAQDLRACAEHANADAEVVSSLRRNAAGLAALLEALGQAYTHGAEPDWAAVSGAAPFLPPPRYPWQRRLFRARDAVPNVPPSLANGERALGPAERHHGAPEPHPHPAVPAYHQPPAPADPFPDKDLAWRLREEAASVLAADPAGIDPDVPVNTLGLDSLLAVELARRVRWRFGFVLPMRTLLRGGTLNELAEQAQLPSTS